jgi:hypothetical protein
MLEKCILAFVAMHTREPYLHPCGRQDVYYFLVAPCIVGICLLWEHILKSPLLDH